jgi:hypothetical protein
VFIADGNLSRCDHPRNSKIRPLLLTVKQAAGIPRTERRVRSSPLAERTQASSYIGFAPEALVRVTPLICDFHVART